MASQKIDFLSPVMRMVQGDPFEAQTKDMQGAVLTVKTGPNAGQPTQRYFVAGAIPKNDPAFPAFYAMMVNAARTGFPTLFDANGNCLARDFSWKLSDGDSTQVSRPGEIPNAKKEGFPGHWVIKFSSSFPPRVFYAGKYAPHEQIQDRNVLRRGHYIRVAGTMEANGNQQKPGLYMNLSMVEYVGVGQEIVSGPDAGAIFGGNAAQLPAGAQPLPMHAGNGMPAMPGQMPMVQPGQTFAPPVAGFGAPPALPSAMPAPQQYAPAAGAPNLPPPGVVVTPNPAFLQGPGTAAPPAFPGAVPNAGYPSPAGFAAPSALPAMTSPSSPGALPGMPGMPQQHMPVIPAAPVMLPAAQGHTYEALRGMGYTDEFMRANGMMQ